MANESILNKIRALRAKVADAAATEAEVEAAAAAITKLMTRYDLDESDLVERRATASAMHARTHWHKNSQELVIEGCWQGIEDLTETKLYNEVNREGRKTAKRYNFVGDAPDVEMALYLHEMLVMSARRAWAVYLADLVENGGVRSKGSREDFYTSFGVRIGKRLHELARERRGARSTGTELVVVKDQIIKAKMKEMGVVIRKSRAQGHRVRDLNAAHAAEGAADRVNLNRPFAGNGNYKGIK